MKCTLIVRSLAAIVVGGIALPALAGFQGPMVRIDASNQFGSGSYSVGIESFVYNGLNNSYSWNLNSPVTIYDGNLAIASVQSMSAFFQEDPIIGLGYVVQSGGVTTHFTITSALLSFSAINPAEGQASSGTSVTDFDGDGATFTGGIGGNAYGAYYNGMLANLFSSQIGTFSVGSNLTDVRNASFGFAGMGSVSNMSAQWDFLLTPNDFASGTSRYEVRLVPEPVSLVALGLGGLLALRRRKK